VLCRVLCILLFLAWTAEAPTDSSLYCGLWRSPFEYLGGLFLSIPGLNIFAWQVMVLIMTPICLAAPTAFRRRPLAMDLAVITSVVSVAIAFAWGLMRDGSAYNAYFQLWRFLAGLLMAVLLVSVARDAKDLKAIGVTVLAAALVRATLAIYFYWFEVHGRIFPTPPHMTTHDDSLLFVAGLMTAMGWAIARARWRTWILSSVASALIVYAVVLNNRRLAWVEIAWGAVCIYFLIDARTRRRINRPLMVLAPVLVLYAAVGWGRKEPVFAPLAAFSSVGSDSDNSSLARLEEMTNLIYTFTEFGNPLLGTGWGHPYQKISSVYANFGKEWWQYAYMPHNSLLAVVTFSGLVGIFGMLGVMPVGAFLATRGYRSATNAIERAAAMASLAVIPAYATQAYGDLGIQSTTCALILGTTLGVAGRVSALAPARRPVVGPVPVDERPARPILPAARTQPSLYGRS
jgi:hypothetical protein